MKKVQDWVVFTAETKSSVCRSAAYMAWLVGIASFLPL